MRSLKKMLELFGEYRSSPEKFLDLDTVRHYSGSQYYVQTKGLGEVLGLTSLGRGSYGEVLALNDRWAIKFGLDGVDAAFNNFVKFCMKPENVGNAHLPRFLYAGEYEGYGVYIMERLESPSMVERDFIVGKLRTSVQTAQETRRARLRGEHEDAVGVVNVENRWFKVDESAFGPELQKVCERLSDYNRDLNQGNPDWDLHTWDLHGGNVMVRGDMPVIVDPWC